MPAQVIRHDGFVVHGALSREGSVFASRSWQDLVLGDPAPNGAVRTKAMRPSRQLQAFDEGDQALLTADLGH
jgi:hypothetical protein